MTERPQPIQQTIAQAVQKQPDPFEWARRITDQIQRTDLSIRDGLEKRFEELFLECIAGNNPETSLPEQGVIYTNVSVPDNGGNGKQQKPSTSLDQLPPEERVMYLRRRAARNEGFNTGKDGRSKVKNPLRNC